MHSEFYHRLRCPHCQARLGLHEEADTGWLDCLACVARFPIVDGIPRFVPVGSYAEHFGILWNAFRSAVLDSALGVTQSHDRFFHETGWTADDLRDRWVLEAGCGAGRFTEILLDCGANVVAVDLSSAIDVCRRNLGSSPQLHLLQADVFALPFRLGTFDAVCSFGMLHRTPDARRACLALAGQLRDGGRLAVDIAAPRLFRRYGPTAWLRMVTQRMPTDRAISFSLRLARWLLPLQQTFGRVPLVGQQLQRLFPVAPVETLHACSRDAVEQRACLAMCDRLTAVHHHPVRSESLQAWLQEAGLESTLAIHESYIAGRGRKPMHLTRAA